MKRKLLGLFAVASLFSASYLTSCASKPSSTETKATDTKVAASNATYELVQKSDVEWSYLNPKRKDKAPMAGTLWGDRKGTQATGFLLKPKDKFSSPPHIHNVSYRGIVISGLIHNDDPDAANMWMPAGSYWTQPKGEIHITSAQGTDALAYIEIDKGPYLVLPAEEHFDSGERPVNIDKSNIVWVGASEITWIDHKAAGPNAPKVAFLWGERQAGTLHGTLVKIPAGFEGTIQSQGDIFRAIVLKGQPQYGAANEVPTKTLETGSYFGSKDCGVHQLSTKQSGEVMLYVRTDDAFDIVSK